MSFSDAIPVNQMKRSRSSAFASSRVRQGRVEQGKVEIRQQVNISPETSQRAAAKAKLGNALMSKLSYHRIGEFGKDATTGVYLSATA